MLATCPTLYLFLGSLHSGKSTYPKKMILKIANKQTNKKNSEQENPQYLPNLEGHMINMGANRKLNVARKVFSEDLGKGAFPLQRFCEAVVFQLRENVIIGLKSEGLSFRHSVVSN